MKNYRDIMQRHIFKIKNYKAISNENSRQYRAAISVELFDSLIISLKDELTRYKIIYRAVNTTRRYNAKKI